MPLATNSTGSQKRHGAVLARPQTAVKNAAPSRCTEHVAAAPLHPRPDSLPKDLGRKVMGAQERPQAQAQLDFQE